jgi:acetylornithine deacetylase/succinyl-diaminopimelate desuccinylase-like protein
MSVTPDSAVRTVHNVRTYIEARRTACLGDLTDWLRIPSVSARPEHAADVRRSADRRAAELTETGLLVSEVWEIHGAPAVFVEWPSPAADTHAADSAACTGAGGSGPAADLQDVLGAPVLFLGASVPSDAWHALNEKVELDLLPKGVGTTADLWGDLAEHRREPRHKAPSAP